MHHHHSALILNVCMCARVCMWFYLPLNCSCVVDLFTFLARFFSFFALSISHPIPLRKSQASTVNIVRLDYTDFGYHCLPSLDKFQHPDIMLQKAHKRWTFCHSYVVWIHTHTAKGVNNSSSNDGDNHDYRVDNNNDVDDNKWWYYYFVKFTMNRFVSWFYVFVLFFAGSICRFR